MTILLADLGGTHLRLARTHDIKNVEKFVIADYPNIEGVLKGYEEKITMLYLAAAIQPINGVIEDKRFGDKSHWSIEIQKLKTALNIKDIIIVNDLEAAAYGISKLKGGQTQSIISPQNDQTHFINPPKLIVGIGTGIGHALLFEKSGHDSFVQRSHGGHMPIAIITDEQRDILDKINDLKTKGRDLIVEDIVSGNGLTNLKNLVGSDIALRLFAEFLGIYCNILVSVTGAYGGVYLTGGVMNELIGRKQFDEDAFTKFFLRPMVPVVNECLGATPVYYTREENMPIMGLYVLSQQ